VRMLDTAREQRRRTDEEAAALRERLDREAADRRASLLAEIEALEQRRSTLLAQFALLVRPPAIRAGGSSDASLRRLPERLLSRSRTLRAP